MGLGLALGRPRHDAAQFHAARQVVPAYIEGYRAEARAAGEALTEPEKLGVMQIWCGEADVVESWR
jgi:hypothetical protein